MYFNLTHLIYVTNIIKSDLVVQIISWTCGILNAVLIDTSRSSSPLLHGTFRSLSTFKSHSAISQNCRRIHVSSSIPGIISIGRQFVGWTWWEVGLHLLPVSGGHNLGEPQPVHVGPPQQDPPQLLHQRSNLACHRPPVHVGPLMQKLRGVLLGRSNMNGLRFPQVMATRDWEQVEPNLPPGPSHKLSANGYYTRDGRRDVNPPTVLADGTMALESGEGSGAAVEKRRTTPGRVYQYSIHDATSP